MIIIHEGIPGAGKSYDAVRKILDALKLGRKVYTNIDGLNQESCLEYIANFCGLTRDSLPGYLQFIDKSQIMHFWDFIDPGSLIVIDEAQLYFNSRDFTKQSNREISDWASTHRHHGFDVIMISQRAERIDTAVRSLAEFKYRYRKLSFLGPVKGFMVYTFIGDDDRHISFQKRNYDKAIFPAYNSYQGDASEKKFQKVPNIFKHPVFLSIPIMFALAIYFASTGNLFSSNPLDISGRAIASEIPPQKNIMVSMLQDSAADPPAQLAQGSAVESLYDPQEILVFPVSGSITMNNKQLLMVDSIIISSWADYDPVNLVVGIERSKLPAALRLKIDKIQHSELENQVSVTNEI